KRKIGVSNPHIPNLGAATGLSTFFESIYINLGAAIPHIPILPRFFFFCSLFFPPLVQLLQELGIEENLNLDHRALFLSFVGEHMTMFIGYII
ncbi:hypothetical protein ACJX0J_021008, partial [Zea mays]